MVEVLEGGFLVLFLFIFPLEGGRYLWLVQDANKRNAYWRGSDRTEFFGGWNVWR